MSQIEATILGQSYSLACPPGGEHLVREAIAIVDREMSAIRDAGKVKAPERMAVLAALNLAYQRAEKDGAGAATSQAAPSSRSLAARGDALPGDAELDLDRLIRRIDAAIGDDTHLL